MTTDTAGTTLRDQLSASFDTVMAETPVTEPAAPVQTEPATQEAEPATAETTQGRTAGRQRDEKGRLMPGKAERPEAAPAVTTPASEAPKPWEYKRPSSWRPETSTYWEKLAKGETLTVEEARAFAEEAHKRDGDYAKGVSTYKAEYDRLKPFGDVVTPYVPIWEQAGVQPHEAIRNLAETDRVLRSGSKEEKLRLMAYMAQSYGVPMHEMLVQGEDGKIYFNQQYAQAQQQQQPQGLTPEQVQQMIDQRTAQTVWLQKVADFRAAKDSSGNPRYPHLKEVETDMAGLLRAGLAQDLNDAYDAALRLPKHSALFEAQQKLAAEQKAKEVAAEKTQTATRARTAAVSVKSQSPTGTVASTDKGRKGLRDTLYAAFEQHEGDGRV